MITLIHKQIIAMAGYYACGAFIFWLKFCFLNFLKMLVEWQTVCTVCLWPLIRNFGILNFRAFTVDLFPGVGIQGSKWELI